MNENKEFPIQNLIYEIRGQKVMLDSDLAVLYQVEVKDLNRTVKRNIKRFPEDFMFQLSNEEWEKLKHHFSVSDLRCQFGTAKMVEKIRYNPYVFTEQGIAMLSGLLNSDIAINVNIQIMRAFVKLRHFVHTQIGTNEQMSELRKLLLLHIDNNDYKFSEYDKTIKQILIALNNLIEKPKETKKIGF
ncbi:MAG: ORF6N domain-containing protein [Treponema sp.]|nr:ORF6N domain-containing protein [Treponema sp.]